MDKIVTYKEHKQNAYKVYKEWIEFALKAGEQPNKIKAKHMETYNKNIELFNNPYSIYYQDKLLQAENEGILKALKELIN